MTNITTTGKRLFHFNHYIVLLLSFSLVLLFWLTFGYEQYVKMTNLYRIKNHLLTQIAEMETQLESAPATESLFINSKADRERLEQLIPSPAALSDVLNNLAMFLRNENTNIDKITIGEIHQYDYYSNIKLELTLSGRPDDISIFVTKFASMDQLLLVENISWRQDKKSYSAELTITCYLILQNFRP